MKQRATEHPILMCGEMVRAILAGKKTETRRMAGLNEINDAPNFWRNGHSQNSCACLQGSIGNIKLVFSHYGVAGDTLWVRETFHIEPENKIVVHECSTTRPIPEEIYYRADYRDNSGMKWKPSLFMRKEQSRIALTVNGVTLERLHEITDEGAMAEGVKDRAEYYRIWKELNGEESWNLNPWVWVVKFDVKEIKK